MCFHFENFPFRVISTTEYSDIVHTAFLLWLQSLKHWPYLIAVIVGKVLVSPSQRVAKKANLDNSGKTNTDISRECA